MGEYYKLKKGTPVRIHDVARGAPDEFPCVRSWGPKVHVGDDGLEDVWRGTGAYNGGLFEDADHFGERKYYCDLVVSAAPPRDHEALGFTDELCAELAVELALVDIEGLSVGKTVLKFDQHLKSFFQRKAAEREE